MRVADRDRKSAPSGVVLDDQIDGYLVPDERLRRSSPLDAKPSDHRNWYRDAADHGTQQQ